LCVYGALNYRNGQTHYMVHPKKSARQFLSFIRRLLAANRKRFLVLVMDNATYHRTGAVLDLLTEHEEHVFVVWLPIYSPELNAIEGLWGHLKKTALNNYFFGDTVRLEDAIDRAFYELNRHPETALSLAYHTIKNLGKTALVMCP
jgi:putative transposase